MIWISTITFISLVDYSSLSGLGLPKGFGTGYWIHAAGYFIAGLLFTLAFGKRGQPYLHIALSALFLIGVLFEIAQKHIPKRSFNLVDIVANGLGLISFYFCYHLTRTIRNLPNLKYDQTAQSSREGSKTKEDRRGKMDDVLQAGRSKKDERREV